MKEVSDIYREGWEVWELVAGFECSAGESYPKTHRSAPTSVRNIRGEEKAMLKFGELFHYFCFTRSDISFLCGKRDIRLCVLHRCVLTIDFLKIVSHMCKETASTWHQKKEK